MYAGTTLRNASGNLIGVHQKIDRVARRLIEDDIPAWCNFPSAKHILQFEGKNGPDGIKRKSPAVDEPWHFINPHDPGDTALLDMIDEHIYNLAVALKNNDQHRAAFEAAWMAHAVTDGLTPPHHFPLEEKLMELRGGEGLETRNSVLKKNLMPGETPLKTIKNNWQFWGAKGAMTMHASFEAGVASVIAYQRFNKAKPSEKNKIAVKNQEYQRYYRDVVQRVAQMNMYETFGKKGWTTQLARQTNQELMPLIIQAVIIGWLTAMWRAETL